MLCNDMGRQIASLYGPTKSEESIKDFDNYYRMSEKLIKFRSEFNAL
jgi:hypothetical protein